MTFPIPFGGDGTVLDPAWGDAITDAVNDHENRLDAQEASSWTPYTVSWTAVTVNPAVGNGVMISEYQYNQYTKKVDIRIKMTAGSTTTFGTGVWFWSLPIQAAATERSMGVKGAAWFLDGPSTGEGGSFIKIESGGTSVRVFGTGSTSSWNSTTPIPWAASNDVYTLKFEYTGV